jgi:hypothetical protein
MVCCDLASVALTTNAEINPRQMVRTTPDIPLSKKAGITLPFRPLP